MHKQIEQWKTIEGFEGLYEISNLGNVKRLYKNGKTRILSPSIKKNGYRQVVLSKNNVHYTCLLHRLVALAFVPNTDALPEVDHIIPISCGGTDEASNLRWCTRKNNANNPFTKVNVSRINKGRKHSEEWNMKKMKPVFQYSLDLTLIRQWKSVKECEENGFHRVYISKCCKNKLQQYKGYKWSFTPL